VFKSILDKAPHKPHPQQAPAHIGRETARGRGFAAAKPAIDSGPAARFETYKRDLKTQVKTPNSNTNLISAGGANATGKSEDRYSPEC